MSALHGSTHVAHGAPAVPVGVVGEVRLAVKADRYRVIEHRHGRRSALWNGKQLRMISFAFSVCRYQHSYTTDLYVPRLPSILARRQEKVHW